MKQNRNRNDFICRADLLFYHDVWNTEDGVNWTQLEMEEPFTPQRGMIGGSTIFKGRIWLLGGGTYETAGHPGHIRNNDVWSSPDGAVHFRFVRVRRRGWPGNVPGPMDWGGKT